MNNNKTLLIVVGCSFIEGAGIKTTIKNHFRELVVNGIGHTLQKKLKYDTLYNIGIGNSGIDGQLDVFTKALDVQKIREEFTRVTLFLLNTYPTRYNKYINRVMNTIKIDEYNKIESIKKNQEVDNIYYDAIRDQAKFINTFNFIANSNDWDFIWTNVVEIDSEQEGIVNCIDKRIPSNFDGLNIIPYEYLSKKYWLSSDNHPNENGYRWIGERIYKWIIENRPELENGRLHRLDKHEIYTIGDPLTSPRLTKLS